MKAIELEKDYRRVLRMTESCAKIVEYTEDVSFDDFFNDEILQLAISKLIEQVAERVRTTSLSFRAKYDAYPWRAVINMRNILAHEYWRIDVDAVYKVSLENIPELLDYLVEIKTDMEQQDFS